MKIRFVVIGKTDEEYLREGITEYLTRLRRYVPVEYIELPALRNASSLSLTEQQSREKEIFEKNLQAGETVVLLDERGRQMKSTDFSVFLNQRMVSGIKSLVFLVGGPYGFHPSFKK